MPFKGFKPQSFLEVLTDAVADMVDHGFDSKERLERWMRLLREAALREFKTLPEIEDMLRAALRSIYTKHVENEQILQWHPTVEPFTLRMVKPRMRDELDRRIAASRDLIKLNQEQAMADTERRFAGWASSIPPGGAAEPDKAAAKNDIKRGIAGLPFIQRRVIIDQGHKLVSNISAVLAEEADAIAGIWHSHWRQPGYNYREDHKERDEHVYLIRDSWAHKDGLVKPGPAGFTDEITQPGEEVYCRCFYQYVYNLRDLPDDMITEKGRAALAEVRRRLAGALA